jgi:hypothetical protein
MRAIALNAAISGFILAEPEACWFTALALDCPAGPSTIRCTGKVLVARGQRKLAAILAADVVGYSRQTARR